MKASEELLEMYHHGVNCVEISSRSLDHGVVSNICLDDVGLCFDLSMECSPSRYTSERFGSLVYSALPT